MTTEEILSNHAQMTLLVVVAAGLCVRGRVTICWSFFVYLVAVLASTCLITY